MNISKIYHFMTSYLVIQLDMSKLAVSILMIGLYNVQI